MIRAKFYVSKLGSCQWSNGSEINEIELSPVVSGSEENKEFFKYTPSGVIKLGVTQKQTADLFEIGKEYYVDFTKV